MSRGNNERAKLTVFIYHVDAPNFDKQLISSIRRDTLIFGWIVEELEEIWVNFWKTFVEIIEKLRTNFEKNYKKKKIKIILKPFRSVSNIFIKIFVKLSRRFMIKFTKITKIIFEVNPKFFRNSLHYFSTFPTFSQGFCNFLKIYPKFLSN